MPSSPVPMSQAILDTAQRIMQTVGYNGLSFRDVAAEVGIKSASVHYHFPTKAQLAVAVTRRYTDNLVNIVAGLSAQHPSPADTLAAYVGIFRNTVGQTGRICLCGMLAAEADAVPPEVQEEVRRFIDLNVDWLSGIIAHASDVAAAKGDARDQALALFAALEGAMLIARGSGDFSRFDTIIRQFLRTGLLPR